eukprot:2005656-Amphidinium_carterae.1
MTEDAKGWERSCHGNANLPLLLTDIRTMTCTRTRKRTRKQRADERDEVRSARTDTDNNEK